MNDPAPTQGAADAASTASYWWETSIDPTWLIVPLVVALIVAGVLWYCRAWILLIDHWLTQGKSRRAALFIIGSIVLPSVGVVAYDMLDLTQVARLQVRLLDAIALTVVCVVAEFALVFQLALFVHEDNWNERLSAAATAAQVEQDLRREIDRRHEFALEINNAFREVVGIKADRTRTKCASGGAITLADIANTLSPDEQILALSEVVFRLYRSLLTKEAGRQAKLRLVHFVAKEGHLCCQYSTDGASRGSIPRQPETIRDKLCLTRSVCDSIAVQAAKNKTIEVVPDTADADNDKKSAFNYFHDGQRRDVLSLLAIPIWSNTEPGPAGHVFCLDTDKVGFFSEERRPLAEIVQENLRDRLLYELDMQQLLQLSQEKENGQPRTS
jgi:hypothetical protein